MFTDNGELAAVCTTLGIAHPTGYPLFTILGHLWSLLPLPMTMIYKLNLFSAFCTSMSAVVFFYITFEILSFINYTISTSGKKESKIRKSVFEENSILTLALITTFSYSFALTIWQLGVSLEVYALQALIYNLIILFIIRYRTTTKSIYLYLTSLMIGLGFSNHMTTLLVIPGVLFLYFYNPSKGWEFAKEKFVTLLYLIIPFVIGLSVILYLPIRSSVMPEFNWGWVSRSWDKFIYHASGKQYQIWMFSDPNAISTNLSKFFNVFMSQFGWLGVFPLLLGFLSLWLKNKTLLWFLLIIIVSCLAYSLNYTIHDIETYFILAFIGLLLLMSAGLFMLATKLKRFFWILAIIPFLSLILNYQTNDESENYLVSEYTRILGDNLGKKAIVISAQWDYFVSAFWFKQSVENYRPDVVVVEKELLRRTWYLEQFKRWYPDVTAKVKTEMSNYLSQLELFESGKSYDNILIQKYFIDLLNAIIEKNIDERPVYMTLEILQNDNDKVGAQFEKIPDGFAFRLERQAVVYPISLGKINIDKLIKYNKNLDNHLVNGILMMSSTNLTNIARYAQMTGRNDIAEKAIRLANKVYQPNENNQP
jgi:hypothetical protein